MVYARYEVKINVQVKCLDKIIFSEDFKNSEIDKLPGLCRNSKLEGNGGSRQGE
jgi:hypothetical protein